jgi:hypothetical protein
MKTGRAKIAYPGKPALGNVEFLQPARLSAGIHAIALSADPQKTLRIRGDAPQVEVILRPVGFPFANNGGSKYENTNIDPCIVWDGVCHLAKRGSGIP